MRLPVDERVRLGFRCSARFPARMSPDADSRRGPADGPLIGRPEVERPLRFQRS